MNDEPPLVRQRVVRAAAGAALLTVISIFAAACAPVIAPPLYSASGPDADQPLPPTSAGVSQVPEAISASTVAPAASVSASPTPLSSSPTPTGAEPEGTPTPTPVPSTRSMTPTYTRTSVPGPAVLLQPADGAVLAQPVGMVGWEFSWRGRGGPCHSVITINGPGGRRIVSDDLLSSGGAYGYRYAATEYLPDDALGPWFWFVDIICEAGASRSLTRTFSVQPPPPSTVAPSVTPSYTPTSMPGRPVLLGPADQAILPQPVQPTEWEFSWSARTGPCHSSIAIDGPGGRHIGSDYIPWQTNGYRYAYSAPDPLPDEALGPWNWSVGVHCPGGSNRSETRAFRVEPFPFATPATTRTVVPEQPGLIIRGHVRLADGTGVPNVSIYRAFAGYNGVVVATTNAQGYYESAFQYIPGDEMVRVWAQAPGYTFGPADATAWEDGQYNWRHYYGREDRTLGFAAEPVQPGLTIRGVVLREDGSGVPNVSIYRGFASYPGTLVATTNPEGEYESAFQYIPGDEMVRVWAEAAGYRFEPASDTWWQDGHYIWRHYYGREDRTLDFNARLASTPPPTATPLRSSAPTITPTSIPGPPVLIQPVDGTTLVQPVAPAEWVFAWAGRSGPCSSFIRIEGPGGRQIGPVQVTALGGSYTYRHSYAEPLPDDALWPWNWWVEIHCPMGSSVSGPRTFRVFSATPTAVP